MIINLTKRCYHDFLTYNQFYSHILPKCIMNNYTTIKMYELIRILKIYLIHFMNST